MPTTAQAIRSAIHHGWRGRRLPSVRSRIIRTVSSGKPNSMAKNKIWTGE